MINAGEATVTRQQFELTIPVAVTAGTQVFQIEASSAGEAILGLLNGNAELVGTSLTLTATGTPEVVALSKEPDFKGPSNSDTYVRVVDAWAWSGGEPGAMVSPQELKHTFEKQRRDRELESDRGTSPAYWEVTQGTRKFIVPHNDLDRKAYSSDTTFRALSYCEPN